MMSFGNLLQEYMHQTGTDTYEELSNQCAQHNLIIDPSTFSHWGNDSRRPQSRGKLVVILCILNQKLKLTRREMNECMEAAHLGYLTDQEYIMVLEYPLGLSARD